MKKTTIFLTSLILILILAACGGTAEEASTDVAVVADVNDVAEPADTSAVVAEDTTAVEAEVAEEQADIVEEEVSADSGTTVALTDDFAENALPIRTQLMVGTLKLENTSLAVSPEQASELLVLWQASNALSRSGTGAQEEILAVINQIERAMTPDQIAAIAEMKLTREATQAMSQELGLSMGGGDGEGAANRGQGQNMTAEEKAAREAERAERNSNGASSSLLNALIEILTSRSQQ